MQAGGAMSASPEEQRMSVPEILIPKVHDKAAQPPGTLASPSSARAVRRTLTKQSSQKINCLCSPTTHAGSFRCRHHRGSPLVRNGSSVGSGLSDYGDAGAAFGSKLSVGSRLSQLAKEAAAAEGASLGF